MVGVIAAAAESLRSERRFVPALRAGESGGWTLRDAFVTACGCRREAGPLAYWQWEEVYGVLRAAREAVVAHADVPVGMELERWANLPSRTLEEVLEALTAVPDSADVPPPQELSPRPWCKLTVASTCRIPFVPLAALIDAWEDPKRPWSQVRDQYGLEPGVSVWEVLRRVDPVIRNRRSRSSVRQDAVLLRAYMAQSEDVDPVRWLDSVEARDAGSDLVTLREVAREATGDETGEPDADTTEPGNGSA